MVIEGGCLLLLPAVAVRNSYCFFTDKCIMTFKTLSPLKPLLFVILESSWGLSSPRVWGNILAFVTSPSSPFSLPHSPGWAPGWMALVAVSSCPLGPAALRAPWDTMGGRPTLDSPGGNPEPAAARARGPPRGPGLEKPGSWGREAGGSCQSEHLRGYRPGALLSSLHACELLVHRCPHGASKNVPSVCWGRKGEDESGSPRPPPPSSTAHEDQQRKQNEVRARGGTASTEALPRGLVEQGRGGGCLSLF